MLYGISQWYARHKSAIRQERERESERERERERERNTKTYFLHCLASDMHLKQVAWCLAVIQRSRDTPWSYSKFKLKIQRRCMRVYITIQSETVRWPWNGLVKYAIVESQISSSISGSQKPPDRFSILYNSSIKKILTNHYLYSPIQKLRIKTMLQSLKNVHIASSYFYLST